MVGFSQLQQEEPSTLFQFSILQDASRLGTEAPVFVRCFTCEDEQQKARVHKPRGL